MRPQLTSVENIVTDCLFKWLGEQRGNRTLADYASIADRAPKVVAIQAYINQELRARAEKGTAPAAICPFRAGHVAIYYKPYPLSVSIEAVRTALKKYKSDCAVAMEGRFTPDS